MEGMEIDTVDAEPGSGITVPLLYLVGKPVAGLRAQVRTRLIPGVAEPMWRTLIAVERRTFLGETWVHWTWQPEGRTPEGRMDCGYSGCTLQFARTEHRELQIAAPTDIAASHDDVGDEGIEEWEQLILEDDPDARPTEEVKISGDVL